MTNERHHALYRFYDDTGTLLYVGITADPGARWRKHARGKPWWEEVANIKLETHPDRATVLEAERQAIITEHPRHNVVHNGGRHGAIVLAATPPAVAIDMPDDCHDICVKAGRLAAYLPYRWVAGRGYYQCAAGHRWTCWWGHSDTGEAPQFRGTPVEVYQ